MKIKLLYIGKEDAGVFHEAIRQYVEKLSHYIDFMMENIPYRKNSGKSLTVEQQKIKEGKLFLKRLAPSDFVVLLDERGREYSSPGFAQLIIQKQLNGTKNLVFVIGGAFGFSDEVYRRQNDKIALSKLTFPHIMTRLLFAEQLYRAFSILNNEPYHH
ncbi:MAG: 23S rRNA (pseudouridine(1915)-N(3))-methyltransferase RlmH [Bacteroidales bacterium]|jgi:23S rRNA (pseudouridine1915-N3)-methyltransferase|nr:23S rRNA (pseudouridine(1915)-N(3))-methyltransferase RlmH [Bacteroidales bacterium]